mmetsp:Transcript_6060/g.15747  ORF Transcript_6060/g.15747 Transcript_6060/m.15747 type:complete len:211 (+) Transcript_6060:675-1307(+)
MLASAAAFAFASSSSMRFIFASCETSSPCCLRRGLSSESALSSFPPAVVFALVVAALSTCLRYSARMPSACFLSTFRLSLVFSFCTMHSLSCLTRAMMSRQHPASTHDSWARHILDSETGCGTFGPCTDLTASSLFPKLRSSHAEIPKSAKSTAPIVYETTTPEDVRSTPHMDVPIFWTDGTGHMRRQATAASSASSSTSVMSSAIPTID